MWEESREAPKKLRTGLTTGTCATACAAACAWLLLSDRLSAQANNRVSVSLPKAKTVELDVITEWAAGLQACVSTIKDAGDDPDVTHGAKVFVQLTLSAESGIRFYAGKGVGKVTRAGLPLAIGEAAINPVPRQMISNNLANVARSIGYGGGFDIVVGIENGEQIALKTMNARLGIVGGLSILGTTGIVRPFSCAAWIASIYQGVDVAKANGIQHVAACTGNSSEQAVKQKYNLSAMSLIEMGDFVGALLKRLKVNPIARLTICGGFGKMSKLANNHMDLNSRASKIDFQHIAYLAASIGASEALTKKIVLANTSIEALALCSQANIDLASVVCQHALKVITARLPNSIHVEVLAVNRRGEFVGGAIAPLAH